MKNINPRTIPLIGTLVLGIVSVVLFYTLESQTNLGWLFIGFTVTFFLFFVIVLTFKAKGIYPGFTDFLIGDEGGLSLSRLQAVAWAVAIISYQVSVMALLWKRNFINAYDPVFSEQSMWLLGLSMGSYVTVKGITVSKITDDPKLYKRKEPKAYDLISGSNGLDFSKFQMFIWTILALFVFETKCCTHLQALGNTTNQNEIHQLLTTQLDEYGTVQNNTSDKTIPPVPYLPWSFIVLMGLSQGAYVGKKLVPSFKLDEIRGVKEKELIELQKDLVVKEKLLGDIVNITAKNANSTMEQQSLDSIKKDIDKVRNQIIAAGNQIAIIKSFSQ
jgi:hypothetical protein